jgi:hypothetical protein
MEPLTEQDRLAARHPARVTADRLADHMEKYADQLTPRDYAAIEGTNRALLAIANGER